MPNRKKRRLTPRQVRSIRNQYAKGKRSQWALADQYGVSRSLIYDIVHGRVYADVK